MLRYTAHFDGAQLSAKALRVDSADIKGVKTLRPADRKAIRESIALVKQFHTDAAEKLKAKNAQGGTIGERFIPSNGSACTSPEAMCRWCPQSS